MATVTQVLDRMHAIHQTISGVNAVRFFPASPDRVRAPYVVAVPRRRVRDNRRSGANLDESARTYEVFVIGRAATSGIPAESAWEELEPLLDTVAEAYMVRPRLETDASTEGLAGVLGVELTDDGGFAPFPLASGTILASIRYTVVVTTVKTLTMLG